MNRQDATDWATAQADWATSNATEHRSRLVAATVGHPSAKRTDPGTLTEITTAIAEAEGSAAAFLHFVERLTDNGTPVPAAASWTSRYADAGPAWDGPGFLRAAWIRGAAAAATTVREYVALETRRAFAAAATPPAGTRVIDLTAGSAA